MTSCKKLKQRQQSQLLAPQNSVADQQVLNNLLNQIQQLSNPTSSDFLNWIKAYKGEDLHLIAVSDALYIKAEDKYVPVYTQSQQHISEYIIRSSLK